MKAQLIIAFTCMHLFVSAQIYRPGYVVLNTGDTLSGVLEMKESVFNPSNVNFKASSASQEVKKYGLRDVKSFVYERGYAYDRHYVSLTLDAGDLEEATNKRAQVKFDTVFLRVLQRGGIVFYSFEDEVKKRFYIRQTNSNNALELGYRIERDGPNYTYHTLYKETLLQIAEGQNKKTSELTLKINRSHYTESSLLPIISAINGLETPKNAMENLQGKGFRFGAGVNPSKIHLAGENHYSEKAKASSTPGFWVLVGYDFPKNPGVGKVVFRGEVLFSTASFKIDTYEDRFPTASVTIDHSVSLKTVSAGGAAIYNFVNTPKLKAFASLGIRFNYSFNSYTFDTYRTSSSGTLVLSSDAGEPRKMWSSIPIKAGVVIKQKFEVGFLYLPKRPIHGPDSYYMYSISLLEAGVVYHLTK